MKCCDDSLVLAASLRRNATSATKSFARMLLIRVMHVTRRFARSAEN